MNQCTKCGKEIPEGENKVCEECQKKLLEEIKEEEKKEVKQDDKKTEKKFDFKKISNKIDLKDKKIVAIIGVILAIIVILGAIIILKNYKNTHGVGSTIGNIRNYGYAVMQKNWIYYLAPTDENISQLGIFKVKSDGTKKEQIYTTGEEDSEIISLNISGDYIYFILIKSDEENESDSVDNKICRIKTNGSDFEILNDNEITNDCYEIYVVNGYVYYIDNDLNIAKMKIDGSKKSVVSENGTGYLGITEDYIIYNVLNEGEETTYTTYIMNLDGTNPRPIIEGKRLYSVNVENEYIYYVDDDKSIYRTKIDSNEEEVICETDAYNFNVYNGYAYYLNYADIDNEDYTVNIYKIALQPESSAEIIKTLENYSSFLNIIGEWAFYMDSNDDNGFINLVKTDASDETINLYNLNYSDYYDTLEEEDEYEYEIEDTDDEAVEDVVETVDETTQATDNADTTEDITNATVENVTE